MKKGQHLNCKLNARLATRFPFRSSGWPWICRFGQGLSKGNNVAISRGWCGFNQAWEVVSSTLDQPWSFGKTYNDAMGHMRKPSKTNNAPVNQWRTTFWICGLCSTECIGRLSLAQHPRPKYHLAWSKSIAKVKTKVFTCHPDPKNATNVMKRSPFLLHT